MRRKELITASIGALLSSTAAVRAGAATGDTGDLTRDTTALVLPGGGARGAYEAGVIEGLRQRSGVGDGTRLPGVDAVAGTSIGSINGWFVATAQYAKLKSLWLGIANEDIFQIKKRYRATVTPSSGVLTRVFQAALLTRGLTSNVTGLLDGARVRDWLARNIDPTVPVVIPYAITLTNLEHERSEVFYRLPFDASEAGRQTANQRLRSIFGTRIATREIRNEFLVAALAGSSAIPIVFDPVRIEFADGAFTYMDGGVADSAPLDLARIISRRVNLILVDPARAAPMAYASAAAVGTLAFGIAQDRVLEASLRSAYLETRSKKLFDRPGISAEQRAFFDDIFDVDIAMIRPERELDVSVIGFDDADAIARTYELGRRAGLDGFRPYDPGASLR